MVDIPEDVLNVVLYRVIFYTFQRVIPGALSEDDTLASVFEMDGFHSEFGVFGTDFRALFSCPGFDGTAPISIELTHEHIHCAYGELMKNQNISAPYQYKRMRIFVLTLRCSQICHWYENEELKLLKRKAEADRENDDEPTDGEAIFAEYLDKHLPARLEARLNCYVVDPDVNTVHLKNAQNSSELEKDIMIIDSSVAFRFPVEENQKEPVLNKSIVCHLELKNKLSGLGSANKQLKSGLDAPETMLSFGAKPCIHSAVFAWSPDIKQYSSLFSTKHYSNVSAIIILGVGAFVRLPLKIETDFSDEFFPILCPGGALMSLDSLLTRNLQAMTVCPLLRLLE